MKDIFVGFTVPPSIDDLLLVAESIIDELPAPLQKYTGKLKVTVEEFPDAHLEKEMELETPFDALGCYQSSGPARANTAARQDALQLFRRPILDTWAETGEDLTRLINRVIIQEIGHHFGFSSDEIDMYEEDMFGATASAMGVS